jgi:hypothetical protein
MVSNVDYHLTQQTNMPVLEINMKPPTLITVYLLRVLLKEYGNYVPL